VNTNLFNEYYDYKIKTVFEYSILLTKIIGVDKNKLWHRRKDTEDSLNWIIEDYFNSSMSSNNYQKNLIRCFINDKSVFKYKIDKELMSVINYFINNQRGFEIKAFEKEIVLAASIIYIANNLDIATSPYKNNKNNYKTVLLTYLEKFNKIPYFNLIDNGKKKTFELLEVVKNNVKKERKFFEQLNSRVSFNKYIDISNEHRYYLTQYNYSVLGTKDIDQLALKYVFEKGDINDRFALISLDLVVVTLLKLISLRKLKQIFFVPLKAEFLNNDKVLKQLNLLYKNKILSSHIKILLNYSDINEKYVILLNDNKIDYYVYCSKSTKINNNENISGNYLISREFKELNNDYVQYLLNNDRKIIVESFATIIMDKDLIKESEEV